MNTCNNVYQIPVNTKENNIIKISEYTTQITTDKDTNTNNPNNNSSITSPKRTKRNNSTVQPIKDKNDIERAKQYFHDSQSRYNGINLRNYCLFVLGINCAKRIGDLLDLKISDVLNEDNTIKTKIYIRENKTSKKGIIFLFDEVKSAIREYIDTIEGNYTVDDYLFMSRKVNKDGEYKLHTKSAWRIFNDMATDLELNYNIGTHSMRKTWAYNAIKNSTNPYSMAKVSEALLHSSEKITRRYVGLDEEEMMEFFKQNQL